MREPGRGVPAGRVDIGGSGMRFRHALAGDAWARASDGFVRIRFPGVRRGHVAQLHRDQRSAAGRLAHGYRRQLPFAAGSGAPPGGNCPSEALRIRINASEEGLIDPEGAELTDPDSWRRPWASCPKRPELNARIRAEHSEIVEHGDFLLVSGEETKYSEWLITCTGGGTFRTRAWYVPKRTWNSMCRSWWRSAPKSMT